MGDGNGLTLGTCLNLSSDSFSGGKVCAKSLERSCDDMLKPKKSLDKARAQFHAKKLAAERVTSEQTGAGQGQAAGRTSWNKLLTGRSDHPSRKIVDVDPP